MTAGGTTERHKCRITAKLAYHSLLNEGGRGERYQDGHKQGRRELTLEFPWSGIAAAARCSFHGLALAQTDAWPHDHGAATDPSLGAWGWERDGRQPRPADRRGLLPLGTQEQRGGRSRRGGAE